MTNSLGGYRTVPEVVLDQLRDEIVSGAVNPERKVQQEELARGLGASGLPVRKALRCFEVEGLVVVYPHPGAFAALATLPELDEISTSERIRSWSW
jgi:DNA-binding GntR family transcriptional regulator